jgi:hypothetical protein
MTRPVRMSKRKQTKQSSHAKLLELADKPFKSDDETQTLCNMVRGLVNSLKERQTKVVAMRQ